MVLSSLTSRGAARSGTTADSLQPQPQGDDGGVENSANNTTTIHTNQHLHNSNSKPHHRGAMRRNFSSAARLQKAATHPNHRSTTSTATTLWTTISSPISATTMHAKRSRCRQILLVTTALMASLALFWLLANNTGVFPPTTSSLLLLNNKYYQDRPLMIPIAAAGTPGQQKKKKKNRPSTITTSSLRQRNSRAAEENNNILAQSSTVAAGSSSSVAYLTSEVQGSLFVVYYDQRDEDLEYIDRFLQPDYGGLELESLRAAAVFARQINSWDDQLHRQHRRAVLKASDEIYVSSRYYALEDVDYEPGDCVQPAWSVQSQPNCNAVHELVQLERLPNDSDRGDDNDDDERTTTTTTPTTTVDTRYLAHGYYRDSYMLTSNSNAKNNNNSDKNGERVVLKQLRYKHDPDARMQRKMLTEAKTMELLTHSPVTSDIYGHCSTTLLVEAARELTFDIVPFATDRGQKYRGRISHQQLQQLEREHSDGGPYSFNNFTVPEKLDMALQIAEGLAEMHGYRDGVMVNDDAHPDQWLRADDGSGRVILNDMNNAVVLEWNFEKQDYCKYFTSYGGDYRAPEEYRERGAYVDETVDLWPMGNLIHSLLTGLWPYYDLDDDEEIQEVTMRGERPYLHPDYRSRSLIERRLTEIMDRCHVLKPQDRVDIFTVVAHLRETKRLHQQEQEQQQKEKQQEKKASHAKNNDNKARSDDVDRKQQEANKAEKKKDAREGEKKPEEPKAKATAAEKEKSTDAAKKKH